MGQENLSCIKNYLASIVNFPVSSDAIEAILVRRGICSDSLYVDVEPNVIELCTADLYVWICTSPSKVGGDSDSDNGWSHKDGGYTLSSEDKRRLMAMANRIYALNGEEKVSTSHFRIADHGIKRSNIY